MGKVRKKTIPKKGKTIQLFKNYGRQCGKETGILD